MTTLQLTRRVFAIHNALPQILPDPAQIRVLLRRGPSLDHSSLTLSCEVEPTAERPWDLLTACALVPNEPSISPSSFPGPIITVYVDTEATPTTKFTRYKTTKREHCAKARARLNIDPKDVAKDVIMWNEEGEITESSVRNVALWRKWGNGEEGWVTPNLSTGCLGGTVRRWMIEAGKVREGIILVADVINAEWVLMSNGVEGASIGRITLDRLQE